MTPSHQEIIDVLRPFAAIADTIKFGEDISLVYASLGSCRAARDLLSRLDVEGADIDALTGTADDQSDLSAAIEALAEYDRDGGVTLDQLKRELAPPASGDASGRATKRWPQAPDALRWWSGRERKRAAEEGTVHGCAPDGRTLPQVLEDAAHEIEMLRDDNRVVGHVNFAAGRLSGIEEERARANSLAAEVERLSSDHGIATLVRRLNEAEAELARLKAPLADAPEATRE